MPAATARYIVHNILVPKLQIAFLRIKDFHLSFSTIFPSAGLSAAHCLLDWSSAAKWAQLLTCECKGKLKQCRTIPILTIVPKCVKISFGVGKSCVTLAPGFGLR